MKTSLSQKQSPVGSYPTACTNRHRSTVVVQALGKGEVRRPIRRDGTMVLRGEAAGLISQPADVRGVLEPPVWAWVLDTGAPYKRFSGR